MQQSKVAIRYAKAFFELLEEQGTKELESAHKILSGLSKAMEDSHELSSFLKSPVIALDGKKKALKEILDVFEATPFALQFFYLLADKKRLEDIPAIAQQFGILLDKLQNVSRGVLTTAVEIDENYQQILQSNLEKQTGRKLVLSYAVDPSLLGGMKLKIDDIVLDSSLATQLYNLNQTIKIGGGE